MELRTCRTATSPTSTTETAESHVAENIAKMREDVVDVHTGTAKSAKTICAINASCTKLIVACTLVGVAQYIVGFRCLLEFLFCFLVTRVAVGVVFDGHLFVGAFDFVCRGIFLNA